LTVDESFPVRIGICSEYFFANLYPQVESPVRKALGLLEERFGSIRSLEWPALQALDNIGMVIAFAEASSYHEEWMNTRPSDYGEDTLLRLRKGLTISAVEFLRCRGLQSQLRQEAEALFEKIDILAYPTLPYVGARIGEDKVSTGLGEEDVRSASIRFNRLANLIGYPAISLPCGFSDQGLPIGLQLMAGPFKERLLLKVAHAYEAQTDWHLRSPSLVDLVDTSRITQMHPNS
jgi:aspartyl-tRNA(Asn)/glutamyl-tRNA(Gln) amidotransferase subunit A